MELEFMLLLWEAGHELSPPELVQRLEQLGRPRADGSVRKILSILMRKGYVARRRARRGYVYRPARPRDRTRTQMARDLLARAFGGSTSMLMASLLQGRRVSDREVDRIKELIEEYEGRKQRQEEEKE